MSKQAPLPGADGRGRAEALAVMDIDKITRAYVTSIIDGTPGLKGLLLDADTMMTLSTLFGRAALAEHSTLLVERIDANNGRDHHELQAICLLRPTPDNVSAIKRELQAPRFKHYTICFTNLASSGLLQQLAEADASKELIQSVQEHYADFVVHSPYHFTVPIARNELTFSQKSLVSAGYEIVDRLVQGLSALFLSVRRRPVIRYQKGSNYALKVAESLHGLTYKQQSQVFDFGSRGSPVVLVLDRKDDPVTPLLTQWTYQAMVHELIGITNNTVRIGEAKEELVLDMQYDEFYRQHAHKNYGEVGLSVRSLVQQYQAKSEAHGKVDSLEDMRRFILEHSDFSLLQGNVTKHVNIVSQLSEVVSKRNLMEVSMSEQELASPNGSLTAASLLDDTLALLRAPTTSDRDKVRLVMLYALRFELDTARMRQLQDYLVTAGVRDREPELFSAIEGLLKYSGVSQRVGDLYASRSLLLKARNVFKGLQGVENVYTQHVPLLAETLGAVAADRLDYGDYPYHGSPDEVATWQGTFKRAPPKEVIVFIIGGSTYEEAKAVAEWNERNPACRVLLGGTAVLNSQAFMAAVASMYGTPALPPAAAV